jgi:nucleotide-binding universal stress UspA family protein
MTVNGVVVGVDGSPAGGHALDWAADAAHMHGLPLTIVHALPDVEGEVVTAGQSQGNDPVVDEAVERARKRQPALDVRGVQYPEPPVQSLLAAAEDATFVVLGSRGYEGFRGLLVGSTALHVVPYAPCPVVVVHPDDEDDSTESGDSAARHPGQVVLGYDGSAAANAAAVFALEHARAMSGGVVAVAVTKARSAAEMENVDLDAAAVGSAEASFWAPVRLAAAEFASVPVRYRAGRGRPATVLIEESDGCALAVVGARGLGGFRQVVMGAVSQQLIAHADCPVAVVRAPASE